MAAAPEWFDKCAMADLLGADYRLAADDTLYTACLDQLVEHKAGCFPICRSGGRICLPRRFDVLLY